MQRKTITCLIVIATLALPAAAQAHVSLHPNTLPAGSFPTLQLRVPSEETSANTTRVAVQFPPGFLDVSTGYLPGWKAEVLTSKLANPVKTDEGTITEQVRQVIWSGGKIPPETFQDFPISTSIPEDAAGKTLTFKTVQTYDNGKTSRWIGAPSDEEPAPTVNATKKGGVLEDVAGTEAGPGSPHHAQPVSTSSTAKPTSDKGASKGLGIAALAVAIAALLAGLIALALTTRRSRGGTT